MRWMLDMKSSMEYDQYLDLISDVFHEKAPEIIRRCEDRIKDLVTIMHDGRVIAGVTIQCLSDNPIYAVMYTAVDAHYRNQGYGKQLMIKAHQANQGIYLLRTRGAKEFYGKLGYVEYKRNSTHSFMIFDNLEKTIL